MIDTHIHLDFKEFDKDREEVIKRFFASGGKKLINVGCDLASSKRSVELAETDKNIFARKESHTRRISAKAIAKKNTTLNAIAPAQNAPTFIRSNPPSSAKVGTTNRIVLRKPTIATRRRSLKRLKFLVEKVIVVEVEAVSSGGAWAK